jgi:hypothetical protein
MEVPAAHDEVIRSKGMVRLTDQFAPVAIHPRKSSWAGIYRINRMMRFILGANAFAHKALNRRMNSTLHQAQLPFLGSCGGRSPLPSSPPVHADDRGLPESL